MFLTETQAIKLLRERTGLSWQSCREAVSQMERRLDGTRRKVPLRTLTAFIERQTTATVSAPSGVISTKLASRIAAIGR